MGCELCEVALNEKYRVVAENEHAVVLTNFEPIKEGHLLVQPRRHASELRELSPEEAQAFLSFVDQTMSVMEAAYEEGSICIVNGRSARSQPQHIHAHILPTKHGVRGLFTAAENSPHRVRVEREVLEKVADKLRPFFVKS